MDKEGLKQKIIQEAKGLESYIIQTRRYIHMHPETLYEEENTATFIESELGKIGLQSQRIVGTGVLAVIEGSSKGNTTALRADIDALNILEENFTDYKSQIEGKMHACGHDAHSACLLGAAKLMYKYREQLSGSIKLLFQPAEEGGGGAKKIVEENHLKDVDTIFGIHVWNPLPSGVIGIRKGPVFASSDRFEIKIIGKGGHAAAPQQTVDPTSVLVDIYNALQKLIPREVDPFEQTVLSLPVLMASDAHNIIPNQAIIQGTLRTMNSAVRKYLIQRIEQIVEGYCVAWRCKGITEFDPMAYPAVINDEKTVDNITPLLQDVGQIVNMDQTMVGEDFSFYLQETKGAFITLGIQNKEKGVIHPHHHPKFNVDESVLWKGTAIYALMGFYHFFYDNL